MKNGLRYFLASFIVFLNINPSAFSGDDKPVPRGGSQSDVSKTSDSEKGGLSDSERSGTSSPNCNDASSPALVPALVSSGKNISQVARAVDANALKAAVESKDLESTVKMLNAIWSSETYSADLAPVLVQLLQSNSLYDLDDVNSRLRLDNPSIDSEIRSIFRRAPPDSLSSSVLKDLVKLVGHAESNKGFLASQILAMSNTKDPYVHEKLAKYISTSTENKEPTIHAAVAAALMNPPDTEALKGLKKRSVETQNDAEREIIFSHFLLPKDKRESFLVNAMRNYGTSGTRFAVLEYRKLMDSKVIQGTQEGLVEIEKICKSPDQITRLFVKHDCEDIRELFYKQERKKQLAVPVNRE